jgi:polar amino acid transport system substrate-binding protein
MKQLKNPLTTKRILVGSIFSLVLGLSCQVSMAQNKIIKLVSDPYPPYVMDEGDNKGYITEMAIKIFQNAGYQAEYINVPFKRAIAGLEDGKYDGLLAVSPGRANFVYPDIGFGTLQTSFFVPKDSNWQYKGVESLSSVTFGVVDGYEYDGSKNGIINTYVAKNKDNSKLIQPTHGSDALLQNAKKLDVGRIGTLAEDTAVFWYTVKKAGLADKFKVAGNLSEPQKVTVGFNLKNPRAKELAKVLSDGVKKLKESGDYDKILIKYGLK